MITFLEGTLTTALPTQAVVAVNGVGYEVFIPLSSYDKLPAVGQPIRILTHLHVREDAHILYGFMTASERDLFRLLVNNVTGIGPKLGLAVLSGMSVTNFKTAVVNSDIGAIFDDDFAGLCTDGWTVDVHRLELDELPSRNSRERSPWTRLTDCCDW